jgi:hypothetical protein
LLNDIAPLCAKEISLLSDKCTFYKPIVKATLGALPDRTVHYEQTKGRRACVVGQGELKKGGRDPLFTLNHTCAMFRANVNRLIRKTWNTTKKRICLEWHLQIYAHFHNFVVITKGKTNDTYPSDPAGTSLAVG